MGRKPVWPDRPAPELVKPRKKAKTAPEEYDPYVDQAVLDDEGQPTILSMPVQQMSRLVRDPGRGMMPMEGHLDPTYARYLEGLDLEELKFALAQDNSPKALQFLAALINPSYMKTDITTLAKQCNIGLTEMMQIWRQSKLTAAMGTYIDGAPVLASHVVADAMSTTVCCNRCDGAGVIRVQREEGPSWIQCMNCQGSGSSRKSGDPKARELVFKSLGFVKNDGGGVNVNINQNSMTVESVIEELERTAPTTLSVTAIPDDDA